MKRALSVVFVLGILASGCSAGESEVVLMTHDSFSISENVLDAFEEETGITVTILRAGDAGTMVNSAILVKDNPTADVMYGIDNTFLSRALDAGLFEPHEPAALDAVPPELQIADQVTPIDYGDVCLNFDKQAALAPPSRLTDLTAEAYRDALVVENPATSSPGLAFLLATIAEFGESGDYTWQDYWADLRANGVRVEADWDTAYYSVFSGGASEGDRPVVVSYASSPPAEVIFAAEPLEEAPTGVVAESCFRQIEFAGVLTGAEHPEAARQLVDFMLTRQFQEDIPLNMFVFPANRDAVLPDEFVRFTVVPDAPLTIEPAQIEQNRERWIDEWTEIVLR